MVMRTVGALLHITNNLICVRRGTAGGLARPGSGAGMLAPNNYRPRSGGRHEAGRGEDVTIFLSINRLPGYSGGSLGMWCGDNSIFVSRSPVIQK